MRVLAGRSQVNRLLVLQADGGAGTDEGVDGDGTVGIPAEQAGTPVEDEVHVGLDELVPVQVACFGGVLGLPAVHGETDGPAIDEAVPDGDLGRR